MKSLKKELNRVLILSHSKTTLPTVPCTLLAKFYSGDLSWPEFSQLFGQIISKNQTNLRIDCINRHR